MRVKYIIIILITLTLARCVDTGESDKTEILSVAVSIYPIYDIIKNIAGEKSEVMFIIPIGASPENYDPLPSDVIKLQRADLFIGITGEFDGWVSDFLDRSAVKVYLLDEINDLINETNEANGTNGKKVLDVSKEAIDLIQDKNPHIWLNIDLTQEIASLAAEWLSVMDKDNADVYSLNLYDYNKKLDELKIEIKNIFDGLESAEILQWHPAWGYFFDDTNIKIAGSIEDANGSPPSPRRILELINIAERSEIKVIIAGLNVENPAVNALADEIDAKIIYMDSIGDPNDKLRSTYIDLMIYNANILSLALTNK